MSILLYSSTIIRSSLLRLHRNTLPPCLTFIFSQLSSHHAIPPSQNDDDAATALMHNLQTPHDSISEFLLNECGLSPSQLTRVMRARTSLSRVRSTQTARGAVEVLRDLGFTPNQVINAILGNPSLLVRKDQNQLKPKIDFLKTLGLNVQDVVRVICKEPRLLNCSLENNMVRKIPILEKLFGSKDNLCKAIRRAPGLLSCNVEKQVNHNLDVLKKYGVQGESLSLLISRSPQILTRINEESLTLRLENVKNMGFLEGSKTFVHALRAIVCNSPENIEIKLKCFASLGLGEDEIRQLLMKMPLVLSFSVNKIQENIDFLVHVAGLLPNIVVKYPLLLYLSTEKRLKPRHNVFQALCSMQQLERLPSLLYVLRTTEQIFFQKVLERSPHASILKEIYKGKCVAAHLTIT